MSGATVTADHAQTSDRPAESARRILAVAPLDHPGGAETGLLRLLTRLGDRGWQITVTTPGPGPLREAAVSAGHRKAEVVHVPVESDPPPATAPGDRGVGGPVVGFVGRIEPRKGTLDLVRAAPAIRRGAPGARIVFGTALAEAMSVAARTAARRFGHDDYSDRVERLITGTP